MQARAGVEEKYEGELKGNTARPGKWEMGNGAVLII